MSRTASDIIANTQLNRASKGAVMGSDATGVDLEGLGKPIADLDTQKLDWHIQTLRNRLDGALKLREAFPSMAPAARAEVVQLLIRNRF